jgi:hypothetical protein
MLAYLLYPTGGRALSIRTLGVSGSHTAVEGRRHGADSEIDT